MATMNLNLFSLSTENVEFLQFIVSELAFRGSLIALLSTALILLLSKNNASERSLLWLMLIIALALLPGFALWIPDLSVALTVMQPSNAANSPGWYGSMTSLISTGIVGTWSPTLQTVLFTLYSLVACSALAYLITGTLALTAISRRSIRADSHIHPIALAVMEQLHSRNGMRSDVQLLFSDEVHSPLTWGIWRHRIILPSTARAWRKDLLAQCLSHELAHIQRMDWMSHMLSRLVLCLYWFNPIAWWLHSRFLEDSEKACDQIVIDDTGCAVTYAENLLWFARSMKRNNQSLANALLKSRSTLYRRVQYILASQHYYSTNGRTSLLVSIIFSVVLVAPASALEIRFIEESISPPPAPQLYQVSYFPRGTPQHTQLLGQFRRSSTF